MSVFLITLPTRQACGATVINDRYLLTAGHCIHSFKNQLDKTKVAIGEASISDMVAKNQLLDIDSYVVHPNYKHGADGHYHNDIALVKLKSPIEDFGHRLFPVCLGGPTTNPGDTVIAIGYGYNDDPFFGGKLMDKLQELELKILTTRNCRFYWPFSFKADIQLCAGGRGQNSCTYDSGGPLIANSDGRDHQIGIVSHGGDDCGRATRSPTAFTKVSAYVDWIKSETSDAKWCDDVLE